PTHDKKIQQRRVARLPFEEIQRLAGTEATPTLVNALASDPGKGYYLLDLKEVGDEQLPPLIKAIHATGIEPTRLALQSERMATLAELKRHFPDSRYFVLWRLRRKPPLFFTPKPEPLLERLSQHAIDGVNMKGRRFIDQTFIETVKAEGLEVYVWTINDLARAETYADLGVDGIITDRADEMLQTFGRAATHTSACAVDTSLGR
ncbi:MAG: glycerophosphodiester phosphodiesterase family protein, partial [Pseudomonadota bacterium]